MPQSEFTTSRFCNRNGVASWRVDGLLHGLHIRRIFKTHEEAGVIRVALEAKAVQVASNFRSASSLLTDDQLRQSRVATARVFIRYQFARA